MKEKLDRLELLKQATIVNDSELIDFNQEKDIYDALLNKLFDGELDYLYPAQTIKDLGDADKRKSFELARKYNVEMPIVDCVFDVLYNGLDPREAVNILMTRKPREE